MEQSPKQSCGHDHNHDCSHTHSHGPGCTHCHDITFADEPQVGFTLNSLFLPLFGIVGIGIGFILQHFGYPVYKVSYLLAALVAGYPVAVAGFRNLFSGYGADINLLTTIAGIGAIILGEWAEGAAVLTLFSIGEYLEEKAGEKTRKSIREVMDLSPLKARIKVDDTFFEISADEVTLGDTVSVFPGEKIPVDGKIISGTSSVNQAQITGESIPVDKCPGNEVFAGSLNGEGAIDIEVTRMPQDTTLARIITMVEESQSKKAKTQRLVDTFAKYWTPLMLAFSVFIAIGVPLLFNQIWRPWIYRGLTVLIVSCPCSLVISTPVTVVASIARAARNGVLIKGGTYLEALSKIKALALDKTGTITEGKVMVDQIILAKNTDISSEQLLNIAAAVESRSEHPLAQAIVSEASRKDIKFVPGEDFVSIRGKGASAIVGGEKIYVGSQDYFTELEISVPDFLIHASDGLRELGKTIVLVGKEQNVLGLIGLSDTIRREANEAMRKIYDENSQIFMLTGDDVKTASVVANQVGISNIRANLLPGDKLDIINELKEQFTSVAMIGDGANDAPSLAAATVGIAMGAGTDVALETAGVALMNNDLHNIPWVMNLAKKARRLIIQNVFFSVAIKVLALGLVFGGVLPLWLAVLSDSGAAVLVTFNGLRILSYE